MDESESGTVGVRIGEAETALWQDERAHFRWCVKVFRVLRCDNPKAHISILFIFVPLGIIAGALAWNPRVVFAFNILAIPPLARLLASTVARLSTRLGPCVGGVLKAVFGNAIILTISIMALEYSSVRIVQLIMLGSILANTLLVVGCCFLIGGLKHKESVFNATFASTASSLLSVASTSLLVPVALFGSHCNVNSNCEGDVTILSRIMAIMLLFLFAVYLNFRLNSHISLFEEDISQGNHGHEEVEQRCSLALVLLALLMCTMLTAVVSFFLIGATNSIVESSYISSRFVGFVLLPLVAEGPERIEAVGVAYNDQMDSALDFTIGRSVQIALFVTPLLVLLGWAMRIREPMTLHFESFEVLTFFLSVLLVNGLINDAKSNYLEGTICLTTYIMVALAFQFLPD